MKKFPASNYLLASSATESSLNDIHPLGLHLINLATNLTSSLKINGAHRAVVLGPDSIGLLQKNVGIIIRAIDFTPSNFFKTTHWLPSKNSYAIQIPGIQDVVVDLEQNLAVAILADKFLVYRIERSIMDRIEFNHIKTFNFDNRLYMEHDARPILHGDNLILSFSSSEYLGRDYSYMVCDLKSLDCYFTNISSRRATAFIDRSNLSKQIVSEEKQMASSPSKSQVLFCSTPIRERPISLLKNIADVISQTRELKSRLPVNNNEPLLQQDAHVADMPQQEEIPAAVEEIEGEVQLDAIIAGYSDEGRVRIQMKPIEEDYSDEGRVQIQMNAIQEDYSDEGMPSLPLRQRSHAVSILKQTIGEAGEKDDLEEKLIVSTGSLFTTKDKTPVPVNTPALTQILTPPQP